MKNIFITGDLVKLVDDAKKQKTILLVIFGFNLILAFVLILSPVTSIKGAEPNAMYTIQMTMLNRHGMYTDPEQAPFAITQYTPLYYIICSAISNAFGLTPGENVVYIYKVSRFVSFLCSIGAGYFIFLILTRIFSLSRYWSCWAALVSVICSTPWYFAVRPDGLMAACFFASIYFFMRYQEGKPEAIKYLLLTGIAGAIAFFSKQNGLMVALILGSYLLFTLRIKDLAIFSGGFMCGSLILALIFWPYYSEFFIENITVGINNGTDIKTAILGPYYIFISQFGILFVVTVICMIALRSKVTAKELQKELKLLVYILMVFFPFVVVTALKSGADINYFNEVFGILLILVFSSGNKLKNYYSEVKESKFITAFVLILILAFSIQVTAGNFLLYGIRNIARINDRDYVYNKAIIDFINKEKEKSQNFYVLADGTICSSFPELCLFPHPDIASTSYEKNIYHFSRLKELVESGHVRFCIYKDGTPSVFFGTKLSDYFVPFKKVDEYQVYINKKFRN